jgi:hypothetical protein
MDCAKRDFAWNFEEVNRLDRLTQDYLHKLELDELDYKERAKIATQLIQFLDSEKGRSLLNLMREVLGKTRKVEERMETRTYHYRIPQNDSEKNGEA